MSIKVQVLDLNVEQLAYQKAKAVFFGKLLPYTKDRPGTVYKKLCL